MAEAGKADAKVAAKPQEKKASKPRIDCLDGCRFALVFPIVIAHFARFGTNNTTMLKLLTQENVLVGGFFVISGYVNAYTSTKLGERKAEDKKLANPELFFWQKVMAYYPLHFVVSAIFAPMFIQVERWYNTPWTMTAFHAFLNFSMLQAWFPKEAEIWNQPTWFLSVLTFSNLTMPTFVLPQVAQLSKSGLRKLFAALTGISLLQKVSYSETSRFHSSKEHPVDGKVMYPLIWNLTRFHPFWALIEMTMGVAAVRDVMLDTEEDKKKPTTNPIWLFLASFASLGLRLTTFDFNDAIIRGVLFVPMWTKFLTQIHRDSLSANPAPITRFFKSKPMATLGSIAFPMFILHGPIGQIFYKKILAKKLWGGPMSTRFFPCYLLICLALSHLTNEFFVKSKKVGEVSGKMAVTILDMSTVPQKIDATWQHADAKAMAMPPDSKQEVKPVKVSKPRIDCIDGCRFALVFPIVIAHFARFGTNNLTALKLLTQENVLVGGFFVISGYVSAYTSTKLGERKAEDKKLANPELFFWQRVMAYYPLHFVMSAIFAPMFIQVERWYNTPWTTTAFRAFLNFSMLQAWFPKEAEIWNQPTWFLSALTFSNLTMPTLVLPQVAQLSKNGLQKLFAALTGISLLQKVSYSETARFHSSKEHPVNGQVMHPLCGAQLVAGNRIWNLTRFHPFWALIEMTMGIVAARHVMLDTEEDKKKKPMNPLWLFLAAYASLGLRLTSKVFKRTFVFGAEDAIIRGVLFVPLFTKFLTQMHRDALSADPAPITKFFGSKPMVTLGSIAFPMFILHGPIGQIFYKKVRPSTGHSWLCIDRFYLAICVTLSHLTNEYFVKNKQVGAIAGKVFRGDISRSNLRQSLHIKDWKMQDPRKVDAIDLLSSFWIFAAV
ncbi:unnamed protein product [Symbiodinium necroappetens]|uniref:Acyltransferase 3 domain-containing protein n=1 Tax=Symbiodinium necroappetens TaxID=1628268 RepID=A0A812Q554_9DINO|nr:unnamed protein product [Symbiodinium necroappetens]